jgi:hypothetical protein
MDNVFHGSQTEYALQDGKYSVTIAGSNEFGFANYNMQTVEDTDAPPTG